MTVLHVNDRTELQHLSVIDGYFAEGRLPDQVMPTLELAAIAQHLVRAHHDGRRVFVFGNGACAALASHMAVDLGKVLVKERTGVGSAHGARLRITALTDNAAFMTAIGNDLDYEDVFLEQLRNFAEPGDVVIGLSASGNSPSVLRALAHARSIGATTIGFTGQMSERPQILGLVDVAAVVPSSAIDVIEDYHVAFHHAVVRAYAGAVAPWGMG